MGFKKHRPLNDIDDGFYELKWDKVFSTGDVIEAGTLVRICHSWNCIKCFYNFNADTGWTDDCDYYLISYTNERGDFREEDTALFRKTDSITRFEEEYLRAEAKDHSVMNNAQRKCDKRNYTIVTAMCECIGTTKEDCSYATAWAVASIVIISIIVGIIGAVSNQSFWTGVIDGAKAIALLCTIIIPLLEVVKHYNKKSEKLRKTAENYTVSRDMVMSLLYDSEHGVLRTDVIEKEAEAKEIGQLGKMQDYCKRIQVGPLELFETQFDMFNGTDAEK